MNPPTDIIIGVHATRQFPAEDYFSNCLNTLQLSTKNYRLIVVNDNSDEEGTRVIDSLTHNIRECIVIKTNFQHWFTRAFNLGLRLVKTPWAVMLNCDTVLDQGWLEELYSVEEAVRTTAGKVGLVGAVQSGEEQRRYSICAHPGYVTGHCHLVNMQAISEASAHRGNPGWYYDETRADMIHIRSDVEICWNLMAHGWNCVSSYKASVGHHGGKSWGHHLGIIPATLDAVSYHY